MYCKYIVGVCICVRARWCVCVSVSYTLMNVSVVEMPVWVFAEGAADVDVSSFFFLQQDRDIAVFHRRSLTCPSSFCAFIFASETLSTHAKITFSQHKRYIKDNKSNPCSCKEQVIVIHCIHLAKAKIFFVCVCVFCVSHSSKCSKPCCAGGSRQCHTGVQSQSAWQDGTRETGEHWWADTQRNTVTTNCSLTLH